MFELLTNAEMAEADRRAIAGGTGSATLMAAAGAAVARAVTARHPPGSRVAVVAGAGNNGGDGFVAARRLGDAGYRVGVHLIGNRDALKGDAAAAAAQWQGPVTTGALVLDGVHVVVDAVFGAGLDRPVGGDALAAIAAINGAGVPVVAVDLPSGINGTTGAVMGAAVNADRTVTFFRKKPGHLLLPGRDHCGTVEVAQIGIPDTVLTAIAPATFENDPALWRGRLPVAVASGHKYSRGHAVVVSGPRSHTGAARLAAMAALRGGAGLVTLATPGGALDINAAASLAVMVRRIDGVADLEAMLADPRFRAVAVGPGGGVGDHTRAMALAALAGRRGVVLDADALTSFAGEPSAQLFAALRSNATAVLTPHAGEFHRLFDGALQHHAGASKLESARGAAAVTGAVVVYKGADTVIAAPDGRAAINADAPPWLATAGTGDVLAGLVTAHLAQGMPAFEAAAAAVWIHGAAAAAAGPGMIAEDLAPRLPQVLGRLQGMPAPQAAVT